MCSVTARVCYGNQVDIGLQCLSFLKMMRISVGLAVVRLANFGRADVYFCPSVRLHFMCSGIVASLFLRTLNFEIEAYSPSSICQSR